jgi:hypothetical protein
MPKTTWIFVLSKLVTHGTSKFNLNSLSHNNFKLGIALIIERMALYKITKLTMRGDIND